jgi:hypothetical protein
MTERPSRTELMERGFESSGMWRAERMKGTAKPRYKGQGKKKKA